MAGNQNCFSGFSAKRYFRGGWMTIGSGIAGIKQFHGFQIYFPAFHGQADQLLKTLPLLGEFGHGFMDIGIDRFIFLAENGGMIGVGGKTAQAINGDLLEGTKIFVIVKFIDKIKFLALGNKTLEGCGGGKRCRLGHQNRRNRRRRSL